MSALPQLLETARRALMAQQVGMAVTGHNIANANTTGYTRQRADFVATMPLSDAKGFLGTGVMVESISRLRDRFTDQQIRTANDSLGSATAEQQILGQVEANFNEPTDQGLSAQFTKFFNSWQDLSTHPEDSASRNAVLQQGLQLTSRFRQLNSQLTDLRSSLSDDIDTKVASINSLATDIHQLDLQIVAAKTGNVTPSDLMDQRDLKIDQLSKLAPVSITEDARGSTMVAVGGTVISSASGVVPLTVSTSSVPGTGSVKSILAGNSTTPLSITGGELGGTLKSYNTTIPGVLSQLDQLAYGVITSVNAAHAAGSGIGTPTPTGMNFFTPVAAPPVTVPPTPAYAGASATIAVDAGITSNINNIAASGSGDPGDNATARAIAGLQSSPIMSGGTQSITQFYNALVSQVGTAVNTANTTVSTQDQVLSQLDAQQESVSGVSLDEEMTNMIKFQRGFEAAAKVINTTNEMMQTIIGMIQ